MSLIYCKQKTLEEGEPTKEKWSPIYIRMFLKKLTTPLEHALLGEFLTILEIEGDHSKCRLEFGLDHPNDRAKLSQTLHKLAIEIDELADKIREGVKFDNETQSF